MGIEARRPGNKKNLLEIFNTAVSAAKADSAMGNSLAVNDNILSIDNFKYHLDRYRNIYVVGAGKASAFMALEIERVLGKRITSGAVNVKYGHGARLACIEVNECGHPLPDENGLKGSDGIFRLLRSAGESDLVICLISGGGSSLLPYPVKGVSLDDLRKVNRLLIECGAEIGEINTVRKHISRSKGGGLARAAFPAEVLALIISDVVGNRLDMIASGPTVPDKTSPEDAVKVLDDYGLTHRAPAAVMEALYSENRARPEEDLKLHERQFERVRNVIIADNRLALDAASRRAQEMGFQVNLIPTSIQGEAREAANALVDNIKRSLAIRSQRERPLCFISGGETTVTVKGAGRGGRNTEFALAAAMAIHGFDGVSLLSCGTDGTDGPTDAAGAFCDSTTIARASEKGLRAELHLEENNSYPFFASLDDLIITGPTGTNVMDIQIAAIDPDRPGQ